MCLEFIKHHQETGGQQASTLIKMTRELESHAKCLKTRDCTYMCVCIYINHILYYTYLYIYILHVYISKIKIYYSYIIYIEI